MADFLSDQKVVSRAFLVGVQAPGMEPGEGAELLGELQELVENLRLAVTRSTPYPHGMCSGGAGLLVRPRSNFCGIGPAG